MCLMGVLWSYASNVSVYLISMRNVNLPVFASPSKTNNTNWLLNNRWYGKRGNVANTTCMACS